MSFSRDLIGGVIIILVAGVLGVFQNTVRSRPMTLIPRIPSVTDSNTPVEVERKQTQSVEEADMSGPDGFTTTELSAGELPKERVKALMDAGAVVLVDARSAHEYEEGHLPGAVNIPYENFVDYYDNLLDYVPMESAVICYCRSITCDLSDQLVRELKLMGYQTVVLYRGGWDEWTEAGYPVENE